MKGVGAEMSGNPCRKRSVALAAPEGLPYIRPLQMAGLCMYLLTIRDGLQTRHIGPYGSPAQAAEDLDALLAQCGERAHWQIHELEAPGRLVDDRQALVAAA